MPMVSLGGGRELHYEIEGNESAPPLVLSNSLGTTLAMWDPQMPELRKHLRVIRYDTRGHGASSAPTGAYSIAELGRDLLGLLDALALDAVNWCGLSMGGMTGMWLAVNAPQRLKHIVLADTSTHMPPPELWNDRIQKVLGEGMAAIEEAVIDRWFTPEFQAQAPEAVAKVRAMLRATAPQGYAGCCAAIRDMDQRESIRRIHAPVLVIAGARDPATPPDHAQLIHERIAGSKLVTLDAAHLSNIEQPEAFTNAVVDFLKA